MSMKDKIFFRVACPHCGQKQKVEKELTVYGLDDWDRILSDFDVEEFYCECGESFLGADTVQSEKVAKIIEIAKNLKAEGKFDLSEQGVRINLGLSDIWELLRELKNLEGDLR